MKLLKPLAIVSNAPLKYSLTLLIDDAELVVIATPIDPGETGGCPARRRTSAAVRCSGYLSLGTPYTRSISGITLEGGA